MVPDLSCAYTDLGIKPLIKPRMNQKLVLKTVWLAGGEKGLAKDVLYVGMGLVRLGCISLRPKDVSEPSLIQ